MTQKLNTLCIAKIKFPNGNVTHSVGLGGNMSYIHKQKGYNLGVNCWPMPREYLQCNMEYYIWDSFTVLLWGLTHSHRDILDHAVFNDISHKYWKTFCCCFFFHIHNLCKHVYVCVFLFCNGYDVT